MKAQVNLAERDYEVTLLQLDRLEKGKQAHPFVCDIDSSLTHNHYKGILELGDRSQLVIGGYSKWFTIEDLQASRVDHCAATFAYKTPKDLTGEYKFNATLEKHDISIVLKPEPDDGRSSLIIKATTTTDLKLSLRRSLDEEHWGKWDCAVRA